MMSRQLLLAGSLLMLTSVAGLAGETPGALSGTELAKLAGAAATSEHAVAVNTLTGTGYFERLAANLARAGGSSSSGSEMQQLAAGALSTTNPDERRAFSELWTAGFFKGAMNDAVTRRLSASGAPSTAWREVFQPDEEREYAESARIVNELQRKAAGEGGAIMRGFHAKTHAAMLARLEVSSELPSYAKQGIFKEPRTYLTWVRFSNGQGTVHADAFPDLRGCALKVIGAPAPMALPGWTGPQTQDFLCTNNPVAPVRNASQYIAFQQLQLGEAGLLETLTKKFGWKEARRLLGVLAHNLKPPRSVAGETYWSELPIAFGPYAVKLKLQPSMPAAEADRHLTHHDYLREDLRERLLDGDLRFELMAQFFVDETKTPIEDGAVEWKETDAPFVKLATLVITKRDLESLRSRAENAFGQRLSFNPWHASAELRPIGNLMRVRRAVYEASSKLRGHLREPDGTERFE